MEKERAYAKINLTLDITGRRVDGYHEVSMIMQSIALADELEIEKTSGGIKLQVEGGLNIPTDGRNLVWRAAEEFCKYVGMIANVSIKLTKKIPSAAGLGGGSSDAAAVIRAMNRLYETKLSEEQLCEIGMRVGSDVPFCIVGGTCLAEGRGERLTQLAPLKNFYVVLAKPEAEISTAWAYKTYDEEPAQNHPPNMEIIRLLEQDKYSEAFGKFANVLEPIAIKLCPEILAIKSKMMELGAEVALMSGSGSTVFALTEEKTTAEKIAATINDCEVFVTQFD